MDNLPLEEVMVRFPSEVYDPETIGPIGNHQIKVNREDDYENFFKNELTSGGDYYWKDWRLKMQTRLNKAYRSDMREHNHEMSKHAEEEYKIMKSDPTSEINKRHYKNRTQMTRRIRKNILQKIRATKAAKKAIPEAAVIRKVQERANIKLKQKIPTELVKEVNSYIHSRKNI